MKKIDWDLVVVIGFGVALLAVGVIAVMNHMGVEPMNALHIIQYTTGMTKAL